MKKRNNEAMGFFMIFPLSDNYMGKSRVRVGLEARPVHSSGRCYRNSGAQTYSLVCTLDATLALAIALSRLFSLLATNVLNCFSAIALLFGM